MIEPTLEFNFSFLETIQQYTGVSYTHTELELIYKWYTLRKKYKDNRTIESELLQAYYYLESLDVANAATIISGVLWRPHGDIFGRISTVFKIP